MKFNDLRDFKGDSLFQADLCIIGSGPAGLSIAKEFIGTKVNVLVVESGGHEEEVETQSLYDIENVGAPRYIQQDQVRNRIFGGTSHTWTGKCAPFDPIDFQKRDWIPHSGWPIQPSDLEDYLDRARENLRLGSSCYDERLWKVFKVSSPYRFNSKLLKSQFWQYSKVSKQDRQPMRFGPYLIADANNISVLLHANVTHLNTDEQGTKLESVEISTLDKRVSLVRAKVVILCCGGVENARLLLASNRIIKNGVGNKNDMVGRFLMDHPGSLLGTFDPKKSQAISERFGSYFLKSSNDYNVYQHGLALAPELQEKEQLLNAAAFLIEVAAEDNPWNSFRRLKAVLRQRKLTKSACLDVLNVLRHLPFVLWGAYRFLVRGQPPIAKVDEMLLYSLVEQNPNPESRVTLSDQKDLLGMPISKVNWQISDLEKRTVSRLAYLIDQEFERLNLPKLKLSDWLSKDEDWRSNFIDRAHPTGTTRMSNHPEDGVVDPNCQVHELEGLFISGSSVFPTTGHANPTLMIVAMAIRLADWLKATTFSSANQESQPLMVSDLQTSISTVRSVD
ncbi:MAG: GMC oxidoreductase [Nodosilinea sp.]